MFARFDMKPWQAEVLLALRSGDMSQKQLAKLMNVTPPTITAAVRQIEKEGYIVRHPDEKDQRVMRISITDKTKQYQDKLMKVADEMDSMVFEGMSVEEQILLKRLLIQVRDNLQDAQQKAENENGTFPA